MESVIIKFKTHLQIQGSKSTHRYLGAVTLIVLNHYQRDTFSTSRTDVIRMYIFDEVRAFSVYYTPSQNLVDFLSLTMPFCAFGVKRHETVKMIL